jgi:nitrogen fixation protein NifQ
MNGYTDTIRTWATDTRRAGILTDPEGTGEVGLEAGKVGQRLAVRFTLHVRLNMVTDARYQVFGCGFTMAACAAAADLAIGSRLNDLLDIDSVRIDAFLDGLPAERSYCAEIAAEALHAAVESARNGRRAIQTTLRDESGHGPRVTADDPVYTLLMDSPRPDQIHNEDRHLFACLLAIAAREPYDTAVALGLMESDLESIFKTYFPAIDRSALEPHEEPATDSPRERNPEVLSILLAHLPLNAGGRSLHTATWLAYIIATRTEHPGHLWVAMGLFERPQLSAAIHRHLPTLAKSNNQNMRWKRFLYKQVCDRNGGMMCKTPDCGLCSDYALCFASE